MAGLRCLIDSMIFDAIAAEPELPAIVDRLTSARRLELLAATETIAEVAATPDRLRRRQLQRVRVLVVPPPDPARLGAEALLTRLRRSTGVGERDARIALTAAAEAVPLVTEDHDLRLAASVHLPWLAVWSWAAGLRPRILALADEHRAACVSRPVRGNAGVSDPSKET